jgi:ubiquinone/menaquinone biosynthesis C-methylase UbiE
MARNPLTLLREVKRRLSPPPPEPEPPEEPDEPRGPLHRLHSIDMDILGLSRGERILDVGCGTGRHVVEAARSKCFFVGVDFNRGELQTLRAIIYHQSIEGKMRGRGSPVQADGAVLPFRDAVFDRVMATEVFEHVPDEHMMMRELARVLRPGGTIAVSVPDMRSEVIVWGIALSHRQRPGEHVRIFRHQQMVDLLQENGLKVYTRRYRQSMESLFWILALTSKKGTIRRKTAVALRRFLDRHTNANSRRLNQVENIGNYIIPKSAVFYARKPARGGSR